jgi:hypothetical protein
MPSRARAATYDVAATKKRFVQKRKILTLAGFETAIGFVDHIEAATTANNAIVAMTGSQ